MKSFTQKVLESDIDVYSTMRKLGISSPLHKEDWFDEIRNLIKGLKSAQHLNEDLLVEEFGDKWFDSISLNQRNRQITLDAASLSCLIVLGSNFVDPKYPEEIGPWLFDRFTSIKKAKEVNDPDTP